MAKAIFISIFIQLGMLTLLIYMGLMRYKNEEIFIALSVLIVVLSCLYICFDLFIIVMPGIINKDDYILAALMLYIDIA